MKAVGLGGEWNGNSDLPKASHQLNFIVLSFPNGQGQLRKVFM